MKERAVVKTRKLMPIIISSVVFTIIIVILVNLTLDRVYDKMKQYCFEELTTTTDRLAGDFYKAFESDQIILKSMAAVLSSRKELSNEEIIAVMNSFNSKTSYASCIEVLRSDNVLLCEDGKKINTFGELNFSDEAKKGEYVSEKVKSIVNPSEVIIRNVMPVIKNGKTIYMLYGVVPLNNLHNLFYTNIYKGNAYVYIEDGKSGDFLLDTWHDKLGNISDFKDRKMLGNYSYEKMLYNLKNGEQGDLAFVSHKTGQNLYMHYAPIGVNDWNVIVTITENVAFEKPRSINSVLYNMAAVMGIVILIYMGYIISLHMRDYHQAKKMSETDEITTLQNRNLYEKIIFNAKDRLFENVTCIYIDANGLHALNNMYGHSAGDKLLITISQSLKKYFNYKSIFRVGGDEFVILSDELTQEECVNKIKNVNEELHIANYSIAVGICNRHNETGLIDIIRDADAKMLENKRAIYATSNMKER